MEQKTPQSLSPCHIILVLIIIAVAVEIIIAICDLSVPRELTGYESDYDTDEYFPGADASSRGGMVYLTDEEVKAAGTACTELEHFDFAAVSLLDDLYDIFKKENLDVREIETSSYNQVYGDGGSWYETLVTFSLAVPGDDTDYQRLTLNYDTATGALHETDIFLSDKDRLRSLTMDILEMLDTRTHTLGYNSLQDAGKALQRSLDRDENLYAVYGEGYLSLTLYCYEDGYSIYITREQK